MRHVLPGSPEVLFCEIAASRSTCLCSRLSDIKCPRDSGICNALATGGWPSPGKTRSFPLVP
jgi:hypothetical protein